MRARNTRLQRPGDDPDAQRQALHTMDAAFVRVLSAAGPALRRRLEV